jgi:hypothetical protein
MAKHTNILAMSLKSSISSIDAEILNAVKSLALPTVKAGANDTGREMALQKIAILGAVEGKGAMSKADVGIEIARAVKDEVVSAGTDEFDTFVKEALEVYKNARAKTARGADKAYSAATLAKEVSMLKTIGGVGSFPWDGVDALQRGKQMIIDGKANLGKMSAYDIIAKLARELRKLPDTSKTTISDEEILKIINVPADEEDKSKRKLDPIAKLRNAIKAMTVANDGAKGGPDLYYQEDQPGLNDASIKGLIDLLTKKTNEIESKMKAEQAERDAELISNKGKPAASAPVPVANDDDEDDSDEEEAA